jgi:hypothetical protein
MSSISSLLEKIPEKDCSLDCYSIMKAWQKEKSQRLPASENEGFIIPSQVNYVCKAAQIFQPGENVSASTSVVSRYLSTGYLWDNVRVIGGAYGGFARFSETTGRISFMSYRDPNLFKTMEVYDKVSEELLEVDIGDDDITQAIIGSIGDLDSPLSPDQKGYASLVEVTNCLYSFKFVSYL